MTNGTGGKVNVGELKRLYASSPVAQSAFDVFASRTNNSRATTVERMQALLRQAGLEVTRPEVVEMFRVLERAMCGRFRVGRHGRPSRIEWTVGLREMGKAARGEIAEVEPVNTSELVAEPEDEPEYEAEEDLDEGTSVPAGMREHRYWLRDGLELRLVLPLDLTEAEAKRLAAHIVTLPIL